MNKKAKKTLIVAISLVIIGIITALITAAAVGFDRNRLGLDVEETNSYCYKEDINEINIESVDSKIYIEATDSKEVKININESTNHKHELKLTGLKLDIKIKNKNTIFGFNNNANIKREIFIELPNKKISNLNIKSVSNDIKIANVMSDSLDIDLVSGNLSVNNFKGDSANIKTVSGKIDIDNLELNNSFKLNTVSGNVLAKMDAKDLRLESVSSDISLELFSNKSYTFDTISGNITKPNSGKENGSCYIKTVSGDILIKLTK